MKRRIHFKNAVALASFFLIGLWLPSCGTILGVGEEDDFRVANEMPSVSSTSSGATGGGGSGGGSGMIPGIGRLECLRSIQLQGDTKSIHVSGAAVDASGAVILTGDFSNSIEFGGMPMLPSGIQDIFVVKYSGVLEHQWSRAMGSSKKDEAGAVVAAGDRIYVGGGFYGDSLQIENNSINDAGQNDGNSDPFLVSFLSATGESQWIRHCGETPFNSSGVCRDLALDSAGNIYTTALLNGDTYAATQAFNPSGSAMGFPSFLSSNLSLESIHTLWLKDALYKAGSFSLSIDFDGKNACQPMLGSAAISDIYFSKQPSSCFDCAACLSQSLFFTRGDIYAQGVSQMGADDGVLTGDPGVLLAGTLYGSVPEWGGLEFSSQGEGDAYLIKLDANTGEKRWSRVFGDLQMQAAKALSVFGDKVALAGDFRGQIDFSRDQAQPLQALQRDIFFAVFDSLSGDTRFGTFWESPGNQSLIAMDMNDSGDVVLVGSFEGAVDLGCPSGALQSVGNFPNIFVATFKYME